MATKVVKSTKIKAPVPESIVNDEPRTLDDSCWPVGSVCHQGDLIFIRIKDVPFGKERANRKLADGNTQGSRHYLEGGTLFDCDPEKVAKKITAVCPKATIDAKYIGPVFKTSDGGANVLHPEHGDYHFQGDDMCVAIVYQRNLDAEEREAKVRD